MPLLRHTKKRFLLYPIYEIANFFTKRVKQSKNAHACRISTPPTRGYRYPIRRGSGLFIFFRAFGDASNSVCSKSSSHAFLCRNYHIINAKRWDVSEAQSVLL